MTSQAPWDPALYDDRASFVSHMASDLVAWLSPRPNERILDLGCGTGTLTAEIARSGATVLGVDSSAAMIDSARAKHPDLSFEVADGQALTYEQKFHAVFSNAALHWMTRATDVARGVERALLPGGRFVAEFGGAGCIATVARALEAVLREWQLDPAPYLGWFFPSPAAYAAVLEAQGLVPRELRFFDCPTPVAGDDGLSAWLSLFQARLMTDLGERWPELCREVAERCRPALFQDGHWVLDYVRLRVIATKR